MNRISLIFAAVLIAGCGGDLLPALFRGHADSSSANTRTYDGRGRGLPIVPGIPDRASLVSFSGEAACQSLEAAIEDNAVLRMTYQVESSRQYAHEARLRYEGYYANSGGGPGGGGTDAGVFAGAGGGGAGGGSGGSGPSAYTTTNTQVAGIDEADFVKNDGTRIFVISGRTLRAVRSWPAEAISSAGALELPGRATEMFLEGDRVVVFSHVFDAAHQPSWCEGNSWCSEYYATGTRASLIDVTDLRNMRIVASWVLPGRYQSARKIGTRVFTILNSPYSTWSYGGGLTTWVSYWDGSGRVKTAETIDAQADALIAKNEAIIRGRTLEDWIGRGSFMAEDGTVVPEQLDCSAVHVPNGTAQYGTASLTSFDLGAPAPASRVTIFARADEIYMSPTSVYVTQRHWWWSWSPTNREVTYVHKFDVTNPAAPAYEASGMIEGSIVDQFSLDEHNGDLRVAHTHRGANSSDWWSNTLNRVSVFRSAGGQLGVVGTTEGLAPGERIMSARFVGETGYVVTFRQTDPLYTIDLSNPTKPTKIGELKIPGFSTYIHPIDGNHLLTIGTYQPENGAWNQRAVQLAIFDVSNKAAPVQKFVHLLGSPYSSSSAQTDHRAFNYFPAKKTLAIPFTDWGSNGAAYTSELRLFGVDTATGFTSKGAFRVDDLLVRNGCDPAYGCWSWWWYPQVKRSVMADDYVYAITTGGVRVAKMNNLANPLGTATFPYSP